MFSLEEHDPKVTSKAAGQKLVFLRWLTLYMKCAYLKKQKYPKLIQICLISSLRSLPHTISAVFSVAVTFRF